MGKVWTPPLQPNRPHATMALRPRLIPSALDAQKPPPSGSPFFSASLLDLAPGKSIEPRRHLL